MSDQDYKVSLWYSKDQTLVNINIEFFKEPFTGELLSSVLKTLADQVSQESDINSKYLHLPDLEYLAQKGEVKVNETSYTGKLSIGDTLEVNGVSYAVLGINEDAVVVKELTNAK